MQVQKARTNIPLIDEILGGGLPRSSTVLFIGPTTIKKGMIASQILFERLNAGDTGLFITTEGPPERLKSKWNDSGWDFSKFESAGYFRYVDAYTKSIGGEGFDNENTQYAENPQSINEISIAITESNDALWNINPDVINVYDSASKSLMQKNMIASVNQLISLINKIKDTGAIFILVMEDEMQDEKTITAIKRTVDVVFEFKANERDMRIQISGDDIQTTDWIKFTFGSKGIKIEK